jgi:predicted Zn-ribbon and HTH transcriptional regulator
MLKKDIGHNFFMKQLKPHCPECGSLQIKNGMGEVTCRKCGFVIEDGIVVCY